MWCAGGVESPFRSVVEKSLGDLRTVRGGLMKELYKLAIGSDKISPAVAAECCTYAPAGSESLVDFNKIGRGIVGFHFYENSSGSHTHKHHNISFNRL